MLQIHPTLWSPLPREVHAFDAATPVVSDFMTGFPTQETHFKMVRHLIQLALVP